MKIMVAVLATNLMVVNLDFYLYLIYSIMILLSLFSYITDSKRNSLCFINVLITYVLIEFVFRDPYKASLAEGNGYKIFYLYSYSILYLCISTLVILRQKSRPFIIFNTILAILFLVNVTMCKANDKSLWWFLWENNYNYYIAFFTITTLIDWQYFYGIFRKFRLWLSSINPFSNNSDIISAKEKME